jgi:hypothetical protein
MVILAGCATPRPTLVTLQARFVTDSSRYSRLLGKLRQDSLILEIGEGFQRSARGDGFNTDPAHALGITPEQLQGYRSLMDSLGIRNLQQFRGEIADFMVWGSGIGHTHHMGFVWLPNPRNALPSWTLTPLTTDWYIYSD